VWWRWKRDVRRAEEIFGKCKRIVMEVEEKCEDWEREKLWRWKRPLI
jgi:hypothetical protein